MFVWLALWLSVVDVQAASSKAETPAESYERGLKLLRRGSTTKALEVFNRLRNFHRDDPVSLKAQLAIADTYFKKGDFELARVEYEEFAAYHPRHPDMDFVTWRLGQCVWKDAPEFAGRDQGLTRSALNAWAGFATRYPESTYAEDVAKAVEKGRGRLAAKELFVARFYARKDAWGAVARRTESVVERYADTDSDEEARALLAASLHAWGEVEGAQQVRTELAKRHPDGRWIGWTDRQLRCPPGVRPVEPIFVRPYRVRAQDLAGF